MVGGIFFMGVGCHDKTTAREEGLPIFITTMSGWDVRVVVGGYFCNRGVLKKGHPVFITTIWGWP